MFRGVYVDVFQGVVGIYAGAFLGKGQKFLGKENGFFIIVSILSSLARSKKMLSNNISRYKTLKNKSYFKEHTIIVLDRLNIK